MKGFWGALFGLILWVAVTPFALLGFIMLRFENLFNSIKKELNRDNR